MICEGARYGSSLGAQVRSGAQNQLSRVVVVRESMLTESPAKT
jgi:hypothetical protein